MAARVSAPPQEVMPGLVDWSTLHSPSSDRLFTQPQREDWLGFHLSQGQVEQFWTRGFLSNIPILTSGQCDEILEHYKEFMNPSGRHPRHDLLYEFHSNQSGDHDNALMHCLGQWRVSPLFHDLLFHPKVVVPCSRLLDPDRERSVRFWHDQLFAKPAHHGGPVAWHQDYSYWTRTKPCAHVTVHIALDEQTEENGGLLYIPGSHRWTRGGAPLPVLDFNFKDMEGIKTILTKEELAAFNPEPAKLRKGEASFHHPLTVHGSYENRSSKPRRAAVLNYLADGVVSDTNDVMLTHKSHCPQNYDVLHSNENIPKGNKMEGQFYPLVYDPTWTE